MVPERLGRVLRWKFVPVPYRGTIHWTWEVWTQSGRLVHKSSTSFDTLLECEQDASVHGYRSAARPDQAGSIA